MPAREELLDLILGAWIDRLAIKAGPRVPSGVMARQINDSHFLYLNLDGTAKRVDLKGRSRSILRDLDYEDRFRTWAVRTGVCGNEIELPAIDPPAMQSGCQNGTSECESRWNQDRGKSRNDLHMFHVISKVFLLFGMGTAPLFAAVEKPARIELAENWKLASATEAPDGRRGDFRSRLQGFALASDSPDAGHGS